MSPPSSFTIPECGIVSTIQEKNAFLESSYRVARSEVIQGLTEHLLSNAPDLWICSRHLFNSETLPSWISVPKFGMEIWKSSGDSLVVGETEVHLRGDGTRNTVLLRHKFDNGYYYYRASTVSSLPERDEQLLQNLQDLVKSAVQDYSRSKNSPQEAEASELLASVMKTFVRSVLQNVFAARELKVGIVPKTYTISWKEQLVTYIQC
jgi:hypothetical protein